MVLTKHHVNKVKHWLLCTSASLHILSTIMPALPSNPLSDGTDSEYDESLSDESTCLSTPSSMRSEDPKSKVSAQNRKRGCSDDHANNTIVDQRMSKHDKKIATLAPYLQVLANGNSNKRQELEGLLAEVSICAYFCAHICISLL